MWVDKGYTLGMGTYAIETMGCQMNERDSETIAGLLEQMGYTAAGGYKDADVIVVNTCSVRENADNRFFGLLGHIKHVKAERPDTVVAVCGCMMQQEHITDRIREKHAWVDLVFGTHNIGALPEMVEGALARRRGDGSLRRYGNGGDGGDGALRRYVPRGDGGDGVLRRCTSRNDGKEPVVSVLTGRESLGEGLPARRRFSFKASVNVMYGCDNFCAYCIVPYTRGREISRDADNILAEVREAVGSGAKEILLLGQNVNSYAGKLGTGAQVHGAGPAGQDAGGGAGACAGAGGDVKPGGGDDAYKRAGDDAYMGGGDDAYKRAGDDAYMGGGGAVDFADLIGMVDGVPGVERIRFMTSHPKDLSDKLIEMFRPAGEGGAARLCPAIHLPVQAGSTRVLERMNRRYTKEGYIALAGKLRAARPDIAITTDLIVGFPGETDEDFEDTMDLIERVRFDSAFTFLYSPRKGTPAAGFGDAVPEAVMRERFGRMVARLNAITLEKNRAFVGTAQEVLVEGPSKTNAAMMSGRTPHGKLVSFPAPAGETVPGGEGAPVGETGPIRAGAPVGETGPGSAGAPVGETGPGSERVLVGETVPGSAGALIGETVPVCIASVNTFSFTGELLALKEADDITKV